MSKEIGKRIRHHRIERQMRQEELCQGICSVSQLSKIETGKAQIKPEQLQVFANRLGKTVAELESDDAACLEILSLIQYANKARELGQYDRSLSLCDTALMKCRNGENHELRAKILLLRLNAFYRKESWEDVLEKGLDLLGGEYEFAPPEWVKIYMFISDAYKHQGQYAKMLELQAIALKYLDQTPLDHEEAASAFVIAADIIMTIHASREAYYYTLTSMKWYAKQGSQRYINNARNNLANCYFGMKMYQEAAAIFEETYENSMENAFVLFAGIAEHNLGCIAQLTDNLPQARDYFEKALHCFEMSAGVQYVRMEPYLEMADVSVREGKYAECERRLQEIEAMFPETPGAKYLYQARIARTRAESCGAQGKREEQVHFLQDALDIYVRHTVWFEAYEVAVDLAELLEPDQPQAALEHYRSALSYHDRFEMACGRKLLEQK